ncbi:hypothetical protein M2459_003555 [Parabacteroides sp. PF5-5]|nr:hypothetical protein [Parabacteroides sp. PH5-39]MDH6317794.1 hypothetical protein [Parabacteroides sp. PF5-13]MDH6321550.1 hypothetical protein [Parabacteroides sp. PH5-13]MDH6325332.1 hypothetical protein [Parabacteroides sp. PH5-8]MDH6329003.1 hypothetical protein [Parabacteroides sp. PH5-41]MDH6336781.1 hypothetical protein [Parabacteroides sp. PF5-5]MDH6347871.1 hypothetical protein [Parabacteroides sp. PH5-46]MDH6362831.1 hypothetical protein [Parabacteroides sp. PH5-16]MDH6378500.
MAFILKIFAHVQIKIAHVLLKIGGELFISFRYPLFYNLYPAVWIWLVAGLNSQ